MLPIGCNVDKCSDLCTAIVCVSIEIPISKNTVTAPTIDCISVIVGGVDSNVNYIDNILVSE